MALYACLQTRSSGLCRYFGKLRLAVTRVAGCVLLRVRRYGLRCLRLRNLADGCVPFLCAYVDYDLRRMQLRNLDYVRLSCGVLLLICRKHPHLPDYL